MIYCTDDRSASSWFLAVQFLATEPRCCQSVIVFSGLHSCLTCSWTCSHRTHGDLVTGLYQQILLSLQKVLADPVRPLCSHYGAVVGLHALGWKVRRAFAFYEIGP